MIRHGDGARRALWGGAAAGFAAAGAFWLLGLFGNAIAGADPWITLKAPGVLLLGPRAMQPGFDAAPILWGVVTHLALVVSWSVLFGALVYGWSKPATIAAGLGAELGLWLILCFVVLPAPGFGYAVAGPAPRTLLEYLLVGLTLGLAFLRFQREHPPESRARDHVPA